MGSQTASCAGPESPAAAGLDHLDLSVFDFRLSDEELGAIRARDAKRSQSGWPAAMAAEERY
ncbi:hypothetical protein CWT12_08175 [Actinomyces sp. 432]|nr:hypothetical protein CWT12_08175 [Actinomyces sp. 432]